MDLGRGRQNFERFKPPLDPFVFVALSEVLALKSWHMAVHDADLPELWLVYQNSWKAPRMDQLLFNEESKIFAIRTDINPLIP
jgi:hypothetical protein